MRAFFFFYFLLNYVASFGQPTKLELGMRRNTAQTLMGKAKIDAYKKGETVYAYPDSVLFTIAFDANELCSGFLFSGENEITVIKIIEENGFVKRDSATFYTKDFPGLFIKEKIDSDFVYRFNALSSEQKPEEKKVVKTQDEIPKEKPVYGFSILGAKVWEPQPKTEKP